MTPTGIWTRVCRRGARAWGAELFLAFALLGICVVPLRASAQAQAQAVRELRTAEEVRRLTADQAALGLPVRLRGVVTFFDERLFSRFLQDDTAENERTGAHQKR